MSTKLPLCCQCAELGKTCCQTHEIYITPGDVDRISQCIGKTDFYEYMKPEDPDYLDQDDDPVWMTHVFRPDFTRRVLKRDALKNCTFLGKNGCILEMEIRPIVCRLYPYEYTAGGLSPDLSEECPTHLLKTGETLESNLGMNRDMANRWHRMLYTEICLETHTDDYRIDLRPAA